MKLIQPNFSWQQFLLSWHGRVPRRQYWLLYLLCIYFPFGLVAYFIDDYLGMADVEIPPASTAVTFVLLWPSSIILIKRLHDINLSAWQYFKPLLIGLIIAAFGMGLMMIKRNLILQDPDMKLIFGGITGLLATPFFLYFFWLGLVAMFKRGTTGDNRFGPDVRAQIINQTIIPDNKLESDITA